MLALTELPRVTGCAVAGESFGSVSCDCANNGAPIRASSAATWRILIGASMRDPELVTGERGAQGVLSIGDVLDGRAVGRDRVRVRHRECEQPAAVQGASRDDADRWQQCANGANCGLGLGINA